MTIYRYALHTAAGPIEDLGFIDIRSDQEAIAFGQEVVDDILLDYELTQDDITMDIRDGGRHVGSVPMSAAGQRKAYG